MEFDLVVLGSGAAGCTAAVAAATMGLSVCLLEKAPLLGGGTADSFGNLWVPCSSLAARQGLPDPYDEAMVYARFVGGGHEEPENLEAYVRNAARVLDALIEAGIGLRLALNIPDYFYPAGPFSRGDGRRTIEATPISRAAFGPWEGRIRSSVHNVPGVAWSDAVAWGGFANRRNWPPAELEARRRGRLVACGEALLAHLIAQMLRRGVELRVEQQPLELLRRADRVWGVALSDGSVLTARRGVVIATGGYEGSPELVRQLEGFPEWMNPFAPTNQGDGLALGMRAGAAISRVGNHSALFVGAAIPDSGRFFSVGVRGLPMPGAIAVNQRGERFCDETQFQDVVTALQHYDRRQRSFVNLPAFMIFDDRFRARYPLLDAPPGQAPHPAIARAATAEALARTIGIAEGGLARTLERFNQDARAGVDSAFSRGLSTFSRGNAGDSEAGSNPQLAPLEQPPFYALPLKMGGICSTGLLTDALGRVVGTDGRAIDGLYACGNAAAPTFQGVGYQGGSSIGAGMVFAYLAAEHAAARVMSG